MKLIRIFKAAGVWLCCSATSASAQQPADPCAEAVRLVTSGEATDAHAGWALPHVVRCPEGPAAIAARWRAAADRPEDLLQLRAWNVQIRDQRIADAAIAAASDVSRPTMVRLVALQTIVGYFEPNATIELSDLRNPPTGVRTIAYVTDLHPRVGAEPPAQDLPNRVYDLSRVLVLDPNPVVARAAKFVWQAFTDVRPSAAVLPAGTLSLVNVCGRKFRITNSSRIDLSTELAISPERPALKLRIPAEATRDIVVAARDTARLLFGGREVASAATGGECH